MFPEKQFSQVKQMLNSFVTICKFFWKAFCIDSLINSEGMKKVKLVLMVVVFELLYSCSKSDYLGPQRLDDAPHKKDTLINNSIPDIIFNNQGSR